MRFYGALCDFNRAILLRFEIAAIAILRFSQTEIYPVQNWSVEMP